MVWYTRLLVSKLAAAAATSSSTLFKNIVTTQNHPTLSKFGATNVFRKFTTQNHPTLLKQKHSFSNHLGGYKPPPPLISSNNVFMVRHYRRTYATRPEWLRKMLVDAPINYLNYVIIVLVLWSTNEMLMHKPDGDNCDETILYTNRTTQGVKIPPRADKVLAERIFNKDKLGLLPEEHPDSVRVKSIGDQIVKALQSDLEAMRKKGGKISADHLDGIKWEFVVTSDTKFTSASVPGGKICVSSDLLKHLESDADIATIIGHEVGHIVARHDSLRLNRYMKAIDFANKYFGLAISSPKMAEHTPKGLGRLLFVGQRDEMEADHIGLLIMASAGFDPQEAPKVYAMLDQLPSSTSLTSGKERAEYLVQAKVMEEAKSIYSKTIESRYTSRMAKTKPGRKDVETCSINGTNKVVRPGDCVLLRPTDSEKAPYVARVEKLEADHRNNVKVKVRCYYRPEESQGGRRHFHGSKELFLSDHYDWQSAHTIEGKCNVHTLKSYTKLENVGVEDYFCRFEYKASTGKFIPDRVDVYCKCEMPYNPDVLMVQCEDCEDWFHPSCIGMTIEEASKLEQFVCSVCSSDEDSS